jgi:UDP-N-acetylmuramate dehydrogenase
MNIMALQQSARRDEPLARHTSARIGGPADLLIEVRTAEELVAVAAHADRIGMPCTILGGGANVLVADRGVRGIVVLNRAKDVRFSDRPGGARVEADAGAMLITLARDCIERGYGGLEWAISVPGTVGGAVVGNAGAHGADVATNLHMAAVLRRGGELEWWPAERMQFAYRRSALKAYPPADRPVVVVAQFDLTLEARAALERRAQEFTAKRKASQPPGASLGSMFKNPPGDYAGRLIEACGLKGRRIGGAMISDKHANFFLNVEDAHACDVKALIDLAQHEVHARFGVMLELEVELLGDWGGNRSQPPERP